MNQSPPVTWRTHYALFVLASIYVFNYIDRQLMAILIEPVKLEFGISDTGIGLLSGVTFAVFYTVFGFPLGRLSDRIGRKPVIAFSCIAWSLMTMLCGMAGNFLTLVLARIGVAVGEAGGTAPSVAMVSDLYPANRRSTALSVLMLGSSLGAIVGLGLGGWIAQHHGWRYAFLLIGAPGIFLGLLLLLTVRAPKRVAPLGNVAAQQDGWLKTLVELFRMPSFLWLVLTGGAAAIAGYAIGTWSPSFLIRSHGLNLQEAGFLVGVVGGTGGDRRHPDVRHAHRPHGAARCRLANRRAVAGHADQHSLRPGLFPLAPRHGVPYRQHRGAASLPVLQRLRLLWRVVGNSLPERYHPPVPRHATGPGHVDFPHVHDLAGCRCRAIAGGHAERLFRADWALNPCAMPSPRRCRCWYWPACFWPWHCRVIASRSRTPPCCQHRSEPSRPEPPPRDISPLNPCRVPAAFL